MNEDQAPFGMKICGRWQRSPTLISRTAQELLAPNQYLECIAE